uniref:Protein TIC 214 n=1 Tax=Viscum crassulae TaxID=1522199 RepID=A0A0M5JE16_9MAGN|nr:putative chloroplast RF1 [Viscum crassulae]ALC75155.1 putative chloroplast RF1 [Viscum crassulae]
MIYQSFLLDNQILSLCMNISNSVVFVGFVGIYYGFMTTFSTGPSYIFLLLVPNKFMEEEGNDNDKVSAITGFITGQLVMLISIFSVPLHLALSRPHTITVLALPYLFFHLFWNNNKYFFNYGSTNSTNRSIKSIRSLSIPCIFFNNIIFQFFNLFLFPSSVLSRIFHITLFRCNKKILFVISSFIGWLIGLILFMKLIRVEYIRKKTFQRFFAGTGINNLLISIRSLNTFPNNITKFVGSNTFYHNRLVNKLVSEFITDMMARILSVLLFITCTYYLVRIPSPILGKKGKEISEIRERITEEQEVEIEKTSGINKSQDTSDETKKEEREIKKTENELYVKSTCYKKMRVFDYLKNNTKLTLDKKKEYSNFVWLRFEKTLVTLLFDYKQWNRPLRYIKNYKFEKNVRNEMSQYFFHTCPSDGKLKISFTYSSSLLTFLEMIQRYFSLSTIYLYNKKNDWRSTKEQENIKQRNDFFKRMNALDNKEHFKNIFEKKIQLCNKDKKKEYLPKIYDPLINGPYRGITQKLGSPPINETFIENSIEKVWINKIHGILITHYQIHNKIYETFDQKSLQIKKVHLLNLIIQFDQIDKNEEYTLNSYYWKGLFLFPEPVKMNSEYRTKKYFKIILKSFITKFNNLNLIRQKSIGLKKIRKKVPKWSYKLIDELEQQLGETEELSEDHHEIRSRKAKRIVIFTYNYQKNYSYYNTLNAKETDASDQVDEVALIRYSQQSDFRREIIKGTMRTLRRKTVIWKMFQVNTHSPLFLDRKSKIFFFYFEILKRIKLIFIKSMGKILKVKNFTTEKERQEMDKKEEKVEEKVRIEIAEAWDTILFAQGIRSCMLIIQSILRKYIFLPSLIIAKNCTRMLLLQSSEWSEDFKEWKREMHVKCTYNGVQLSENEFPKNWLTEGLQIKILFPFCLKPWKKSRIRYDHMDQMIKKREKEVFCFLTVWGMEAKLPFGSPKKQPSFFESILKKLEKKIIKFIKQKFFLVKNIFKEIKLVLKISKKTKQWFLKNIFFKLIKNIFKYLKDKSFLFGLKEKEDTSSKIKYETYLKNNRMIHESYTSSRWIDFEKDLFSKHKMRNIIDQTNKIQNKKEFITKTYIKKNPKKKSTIQIILESPKNIFNFNILKKNIRLINKSYHLIKNNIEKSYIDIFLCIIININSICLNTQLFFQSKRTIIEKIYSEKNKEKIDKKNQTKINLIILTLKDLILNCKKSSHIFFDFDLSQTYLFYKFSKRKVMNLDKFRYILKYQGTSLFLKKRIKDFFELEGIFNYDYKLIIRLYKTKTKQSKTKQWKNWILRSHYQYDMSPIKWSRLLKKWKINRDINKYCTVLYLKKLDFLYTDYEELPFSTKKNDLDHISYNFFNYEYKNATYIMKGSPFGVRFKKKENKNINYNTYNPKVLDILGPLHNYLGENFMSNIEKYISLHQSPIQFFIQKLDLNSLIDINIDHKSDYPDIITKTNHTGINLIYKNNKGSFYLKIHKHEKASSKIFFNWMEINKKILIHYPRSNKFWLFPEMFRLYNQYKMKPWGIPIKLLILYFHENFNEKKNINPTKKKNILSSNENKYFFKFENKNKEKEWTKREENRLDVQKHRKKQDNNHTETELDLFLKRYFIFQFKWNVSFNPKMIQNIKVYCFLLRLRNPKYMVLSSIQRGEISLDIMLKKDISLKDFIKTGILIIEPVRLSVKKNRNFIMVYQTVVISLIHKNKRKKTNQRSEEKINVDLIFKWIKKYQKMLRNKNNTNDIDFFIPENILSSRRCREFRIRLFFYSRNHIDDSYDINFNVFNRNNVKNFGPFYDEKKHLDRKYTNLLKLKQLLWPSYRLEDLTCVNRYWFNTNNSSHFSMLRICHNN